MMLMMTLGSLLWIALLALLVWALVRWLNNRNGFMPMQQSTLSAMEILRQRYARGEIDDATFERMKAQLGENEPAARPYQAPQEKP
jgi:putative membrane protein